MNIIPIMHVLITFLDEYKKFNCKVSAEGQLAYVILFEEWGAGKSMCARASV